MSKKQLRKIKLMHYIFGEIPDHTCGECSNLRQYHYKSRGYRKCKVYGDTRSVASDWAKKYTACGCFNCEYADKSIIELEVYQREDEPPIKGQIGMEL